MKNILLRLNKFITRKNILIAIIVFSILLLIPILWAAFYTVPSADDFDYGQYTINVFQKSGIIGVIGGVLKIIKQFYNEWQGTFSAIAIFSLTPAIFGENFYFLTTFILLGFYFFSLAFLLKQVLRKLLKIDKFVYLIILFLFFMLCTETLVDKTQGLYWWNGATYYTIFFSLELIEIGLLVKKYFLNENKKVDAILLPILVFFIGGGNYIVALQQMIILTFLNIYLIIKRKDKSALIYLGLAVLGFGISAIAPGNKARQAGVTGMNPIKAIIFSFTNCVSYMNKWISPINVSIITLILIALYPTYRKINKKFNYPLIVIFFMYCILSAEFTPTLYSMSFAGPGRLLNIIYYSFLFFMIISGYYLIGYIRNVLLSNKVIVKGSYEAFVKYIKENSFVFAMLIIITISLVGYLYRHNLTSYQTLALIKNGEAKVYKKEWNERYKILKDNSIKDVEFKPLTYQPYPIFYVDLTDDKDHWLNEPITKIYNKNYIIVVDREVEADEKK